MPSSNSTCSVPLHIPRVSGIDYSLTQEHYTAYFVSSVSKAVFTITRAPVKEKAKTTEGRHTHHLTYVRTNLTVTLTELRGAWETRTVHLGVCLRGLMYGRVTEKKTPTASVVTAIQ